jgi:hypothetical protein
VNRNVTSVYCYSMITNRTHPAAIYLNDLDQCTTACLHDIKLFIRDHQYMQSLADVRTESGHNPKHTSISEYRDVKVHNKCTTERQFHSTTKLGKVAQRALCPGKCQVTTNLNRETSRTQHVLRHLSPHSSAKI